MSPNGWQQSTNNGTDTIDATHVFRGASAFKAHITAGASGTSPYADIATIKPFPILGILYARVWVCFSPSLPAQFQQFLNFADGMSTGVSIATDNGFLTLNDYAGAMLYKVSTTKLPLGRWACIQLVMSQGSASGAISISLDGSPINDLSVSAPTPTIVRVFAGIDFNNNSAAIPAYDVWLDELVVDNMPVSCSD